TARHPRKAASGNERAKHRSRDTQIRNQKKKAADGSFRPPMGMAHREQCAEVQSREDESGVQEKDNHGGRMTISPPVGRAANTPSVRLAVYHCINGSLASWNRDRRCQA